MKPKYRTVLLLSLFIHAFWLSSQAGVVYEEHLSGQEYSVGFKLKWSTAEEFNTQSFIIERSFDGKKYESIGTLEAAGSSREEKSYHFADLELGMKKAYYRLRQLDSDGTSTVSGFVSLNKNAVHTFIVTHKEMLENGVFEITLESIKEGEMALLVNNAMGDIIQESRQQVQYGLNTMVVNLEFEAAGFYSAIFKVDNELETLFLKKEEDKTQKKNVAVKKKKNGRF